jgi:hypothetical protein
VKKCSVLIAEGAQSSSPRAGLVQPEQPNTLLDDPHHREDGLDVGPDDSSTWNYPVSTGKKSTVLSTELVRQGMPRDAFDQPVGWGFESLRARRCGRCDSWVIAALRTYSGGAAVPSLGGIMDTRTPSRTSAVVAFIAAVLTVLWAPAGVARADGITEYTLPSENSWPYGIAAGPDGDLWFTEYNANKIGRITPGGPPEGLKKPCPMKVVLHTPAPTKVGDRILTDKITTNNFCVLPKSVVRCRPRASTTAGKKAFCATKVTKRGKIRVNTKGYEAVRVSLIVRAKPKPDFADSWKPNAWRTLWLLR